MHSSLFSSFKYGKQNYKSFNQNRWCYKTEWKHFILEWYIMIMGIWASWLWDLSIFSPVLYFPIIRDSWAIGGGRGVLGFSPLQRPSGSCSQEGLCTYSSWISVVSVPDQEVLQKITYALLIWRTVTMHSVWVANKESLRSYSWSRMWYPTNVPWAAQTISYRLNH